jgi:putative transposase
MSQSLSKIWTHLIFSTKHRQAFLSDETVRREMHSYLASILNANDCHARLVGGVGDHVHALFNLSKNLSIANVVYELKRSSSKWVKTLEPRQNKFHWQGGYGAFSVSQSHVDLVGRYIQNQERHHRRVSFQDEYRDFLRKYELAYDERYLWD